MRIAIIGAGIVGVCTAYELARAGHDCTVMERRGSIAPEGSFATAGWLGRGPGSPWGAALIGGGGMRQRLQRLAELGWQPGFDAATWGWVRTALRCGDADALQRRTAAWQALAVNSLAALTACRSALRLEIESTTGTLLLWRDEATRARAEVDLEGLKDLGLPHRVLDPDGCRVLEPQLDAGVPLAGGLWLEGETVGNCRQFAHLLRDAAEQAGVAFHFATSVRALHASAQGVEVETEHLALSTGFNESRMGPRPGPGARQGLAQRARAAARFLAPSGHERFDAVVLCTGVDAALLRQALGPSLPLVTVRGSSVTAPLRQPERGPRGAVIDVQQGLSITRLGQRVRAAGARHFGRGSAQPMPERRLAPLFAALNNLFPGAAHLTRPQVWTGAYALTPDGLPLIGASRLPGVWLNLGHGSSGWTLACGSAQLLAAQVDGRHGELDPAPYAALRPWG